MSLGSEIIDLGRPDLLHEPNQIFRIRHVAIVHLERDVADMRVLVEMIDAAVLNDDERRLIPCTT